eukprot:9500405-Pyramimonas_sp.AAC.1
MHNSVHFAQAALSLVALGHELDHGLVAPSIDFPMQRRMHDIAQSSSLQRSLELVHGIPHSRSLHGMLDMAQERGVFSHAAWARMDMMRMRGNSARHRRWTIPPSTALVIRIFDHIDPVDVVGGKLNPHAAEFVPAAPVPLVSLPVQVMRRTYSLENCAVDRWRLGWWVTMVLRKMRIRTARVMTHRRISSIRCTMNLETNPTKPPATPRTTQSTWCTTIAAMSLLRRTM